MINYGFYHPVFGYFQTISEPSPEQIAAFPEGTVEVPLRPSPDHQWDGEAWVYVAPPAALLADQSPVSHAQMAAALAMTGIISDAEAIGWINGTLPAKITAAIATLPEEQRLIATLRALRPTIVEPTDSIVAMLAEEEVKTEAEMVALFQLAASL